MENKEINHTIQHLILYIIMENKEINHTATTSYIIYYNGEEEGFYLFLHGQGDDGYNTTISVLDMPGPRQ